MTTLTELIARVEACEGHMDDETLGRVICAAHGVSFGSAELSCGDDGSDEFTVFPRGSLAWDTRLYGEYRHRCPDVSLDAALALVERVLPDAGWLVGSKGDGQYMAELFRSRFISGVIPRLAYAEAPTPALALCLALLKALQTREAQP